MDSNSRKKGCKTLKKIMQDIAGKRAKMWGDSIIGFGRYQYSNTAGDYEFFVTGFSPRKQYFTVYIIPGYSNYQHLLKEFGKHKLGKSCLYVKSLDDIDLELLKQMITASVEEMKALYKTNL